VQQRTADELRGNPTLQLVEAKVSAWQTGEGASLRQLDMHGDRGRRVRTAESEGFFESSVGRTGVAAGSSCLARVVWPSACWHSAACTPPRRKSGAVSTNFRGVRAALSTGVQSC
jgi:hypothetical protein